MNALNDLYGDELEILLFPSNIFGRQEPGAGVEIPNGVTYVRPGLGVGSNPVATYFNKVDVNGVNEPDYYTWLKSACGPTDDTFRSDMTDYQPLKVGDNIWNFEKFLIGKDGKQYTRYHPTVTDEAKLIDDINTLLAV